MADRRKEWINTDINIDDIPLSDILKTTIQEAEDYAAIGDYEYFGVAEILDVLCKNRYAIGLMTEEQWDRICMRYHT